MFRKPMRLEKWIAFDGAFVEVLDAAQDGDTDSDIKDHDANSRHDGDPQDDGVDENSTLGAASADAAAAFSPFSISDTNSSSFTVSYNDHFWTTVTVSMPGAVSTDGMGGESSFLPFWGNSQVRFSSGSGSFNYADGRDFFFEISNPEDGEFSFYTKDEVGFDNPDKSVADQFIRDHGLNVNLTKYTYIAVETGESNGFKQLTLLRPVKDGSFYKFESKLSNGSTNGTAYYQVTDDGDIRFKVTNKGYTSYGNGVVETVLRSLVFTKDSGSDPSSVTGFTIGVFYQEDAPNRTNSLGDLFDDDSGDSVFTGEPKGGVTVGEVGGNNPELPPPEPPEPEPEPEPTDPVVPGLPDPDPDPGTDDPIAPVPDPDPVDEPDPFVPPIIDGGQGGDSYGEAGDGPGGGESGGDASDAPADAADGGDAANGDNLMYIYRREEEIGENTDAPGAREPDAVEAEVFALEDRVVESAAMATALELMRDVESLLQSVRHDRQMLETVLVQLQQEYMLRQPSEWDGLRDVLRRLFESGNREKEAINRVLVEMNRQMADYKRVAVEYRDGMLTESLRELVDSAARRSGETGALAKALGEVVRALRDSRLDGGLPPSETELSDLFAKFHSDAREDWLAKAAQNDPMGRELATANNK